MLLSQINHYLPCLHGGYSCTCVEHKLDIEICYAEIVHCLNEATKRVALLMTCGEQQANHVQWLSDQ